MKKYVKYIILLFIFISSIVFMNCNSELYKDSILKIEKIDIHDKDIQVNDNLKEEYYFETITGIIINGKYKNTKASFENIRSYSRVYDEEYSVNDEVFVSLDDDGNITEVINLRRDKYLVPLFVFMICLLIAVGGIKGLYTFVSLIINILVIWLITILRDKNISIFLLFVIGSCLMCFISLLLTSGKNKKTLVAVVSSIISLFITFIISYVIISIFSSDIPYWYMDYVDILYDYKEVFLVSVLISGLGAIMDIAISLTSTINELISNSPKISVKTLKKSGTILSEDILGTMVNVLLFTSVSGCIPMLIFVMRNNIPVLTAFNMYAKIEMIRFMTGCIGILITIPITMYIAIYFFKTRRKKI